MRSLWVIAATALLALAGCRETVQGVDRVGTSGLALDSSGCPDLSGNYAFNVPDETGVSYRGSMLEMLEIDREHSLPASRVSGLHIQRSAPGEFTVHFIIDHATVLQELEIIREFKKPRYREWYHLQRDPARAASIARKGEAAHIERVASLGPTTEIVRVLRHGVDVTCRDGLLELPRNDATGPIRLGLGEDGSILGQSRELNTVSFSVWCGDGCKYLSIPTSTYTGSLRWPRDNSQLPWQADVQDITMLKRPIDEIEKEVAAKIAAQVRADAQRYLPAEEIRARIQPLAPDSSVLGPVEVREGKVWLRYTAARNDPETLLRRIDEAGGGSVFRGPQAVRRIVTSGRLHEIDIEFVLTESPLVLRETTATAERSDLPGASARGNDRGDVIRPAASLSGLSEPAVTTTGPGSVTPMAALPVGPPQPPPAGYADAAEIQRRTGAMFGAGCGVTGVRYSAGLVTIAGEADAHRCISDGLRALDGAGSRPELIEIAGQASGGYTFRISLKESALVRL